MPTNARTYPNSIVKWRGRNGWTLRECATATGLSLFDIAQLEHGEATLHDQRADHLAKVLGCTVDELRTPCISVRDPELRRRRSNDNLEKGRGAQRWAGKLSIPERAHPLVRDLFRLLNDEKKMLADVAEKSGVGRATISDWRYRRSPTVATFQAVCNAIGYEVVIQRRGKSADPS